LSTSRGAAAANYSTATVAGPTNGVETGGYSPTHWISPPVGADVTISGSITFNLRGYESNDLANCALNAVLDVIDGGASQTITTIHKTTNTTEMTTSQAAYNFSQSPAAGIAVHKGDRLRLRVFADDAAGGNMAASYTFLFYYNGPTGGASGDSYITLTEDVTFAAEPTGTTVYLTDAASSVATAAVDRKAWIDRGAGVATDVTNTVSGWTSPIQVTDTAGGTVVDWWTEPLPALTLSGAVRANLHGLASSGVAYVGQRVEVAVCNGDGSSPVVWAAMNEGLGMGLTETTVSFLFGGQDVVVAAGKRLRVRLYLDDSSKQGPMATGYTMTSYYAGATPGASGDTYLTFSQEFVQPEPIAVYLLAGGL
jgi:hypothetical protein